MKKLLVVLFSMFLMVALAGCGGSDTKNANPNKGKALRVGTDVNYPPFEFFQEKTKAYTGFEVDLVQAVAKEMGYDKVEFVNEAFTQMIPGLEANKYDVVIAGMNVTSERQAKIDFSKSYIKDKVKVVAPLKAQIGDDAAALAGKKVAVEEGSTSEKFAQDNKLSYVAVKGSTQLVLDTVLKGEADAALVSELSAKFLMTNQGYAKKVKFTGEKALVEENIAMGVKKGNSALLEKLNTSLENYRRTTTYAQLKTTYFGK